MEKTTKRSPKRAAEPEDESIEVSTGGGKSKISEEVLRNGYLSTTFFQFEDKELMKFAGFSEQDLVDIYVKLLRWLSLRNTVQPPNKSLYDQYAETAYAAFPDVRFFLLPLGWTVRNDFALKGDGTNQKLYESALPLALGPSAGYADPGPVPDTIVALIKKNFDSVVDKLKTARRTKVTVGLQSAHLGILENIKIYYQMLLALVRKQLGGGSSTSSTFDVYLRNACFDLAAGFGARMIQPIRLEVHQLVASLVFDRKNNGPARVLFDHSTGSGKTATLMSWLARQLFGGADISAQLVFNTGVRASRIIAREITKLPESRRVFNLIVVTKTALIPDVFKDVWAFYRTSPDIVRTFLAQQKKIKGADEIEYVAKNRKALEALFTDEPQEKERLVSLWKNLLSLEKGLMFEKVLEILVPTRKKKGGRKTDEARAKEDKAKQRIRAAVKYAEIVELTSLFPKIAKASREKILRKIANYELMEQRRALMEQEITDADVTEFLKNPDSQEVFADRLEDSHAIHPMVYNAFVKLFVANVGAAYYDSPSLLEKEVPMGVRTNGKPKDDPRYFKLPGGAPRASFVYNIATYRPLYLVHEDPDTKVKRWKYVAHQWSSSSAVDYSWLSRTAVAVDEAHNLFVPTMTFNVNSEIFFDLATRHPELRISLFTATPYSTDDRFIKLLRVASTDFYVNVYRKQYAKMLTAMDKLAALPPIPPLASDKEDKETQERARIAHEQAVERRDAATKTLQDVQKSMWYLHQSDFDIYYKSLRGKEPAKNISQLIKRKYTSVLAGHLSFVNAYNNVDKFARFLNNSIATALPPFNVPIVRELLKAESPLHSSKILHPELFIDWEREFDKDLMQLVENATTAAAEEEYNEQEEEEEEKEEEAIVLPPSAAASSRRSERIKQQEEEKAKEEEEEEEEDAQLPGEEEEEQYMESDEEDEEEEDESGRRIRPQEKEREIVYKKFVELSSIDSGFKAQLPPLYYSTKFNVSQWQLEDASWISPTIEALLKKISECDRDDIDNYGRLFKHAIYVADTPTLEAVVSFMIASGYGHVTLGAAPAAKVSLMSPLIWAKSPATVISAKVFTKLVKNIVSRSDEQQQQQKDVDINTTTQPTQSFVELITGVVDPKTGRVLSRNVPIYSTSQPSALATQVRMPSFVRLSRSKYVDQHVVYNASAPSATGERDFVPTGHKFASSSQISDAIRKYYLSPFIDYVNKEIDHTREALNNHFQALVPSLVNNNNLLATSTIINVISSLSTYLSNKDISRCSVPELVVKIVLRLAEFEVFQNEKALAIRIMGLLSALLSLLYLRDEIAYNVLTRLPLAYEKIKTVLAELQSEKEEHWQRFSSPYNPMLNEKVRREGSALYTGYADLQALVALVYKNEADSLQKEVEKFAGVVKIAKTKLEAASAQLLIYLAPPIAAIGSKTGPKRKRDLSQKEEEKKEEEEQEPEAKKAKRGRAAKPGLSRAKVLNLVKLHVVYIYRQDTIETASVYVRQQGKPHYNYTDKELGIHMRYEADQKLSQLQFFEKLGIIEYAPIFTGRDERINILLNNVFNIAARPEKLSAQRRAQYESMLSFDRSVVETGTRTRSSTEPELAKEVARVEAEQERTIQFVSENEPAKKQTLRVAPDLRFIVIDSRFNEGIDIPDAKYIHLFRQAQKKDDQTQIEGRVGRYCGTKNLPREQGYWRVIVNTFEVNDSVPMPRWMEPGAEIVLDRPKFRYNYDGQYQAKYLDARREQLLVIIPDRGQVNAGEEVYVRFSPLHKSMFMSYDAEERRVEIIKMVRGCSIEKNFQKVLADDTRVIYNSGLYLYDAPTPEEVRLSAAPSHKVVYRLGPESLTTNLEGWIVSDKAVIVTSNDSDEVAAYNTTRPKGTDRIELSPGELISVDKNDAFDAELKRLKVVRAQQKKSKTEPEEKHTYKAKARPILLPYKIGNIGSGPGGMIVLNLNRETSTTDYIYKRVLYHRQGGREDPAQQLCDMWTLGLIDFNYDIARMPNFGPADEIVSLESFRLWNFFRKLLSVDLDVYPRGSQRLKLIRQRLDQYEEPYENNTFVQLESFPHVHKILDTIHALHPNKSASELALLIAPMLTELGESSSNVIVYVENRLRFLFVMFGLNKEDEPALINSKFKRELDGALIVYARLSRRPEIEPGVVRAIRYFRTNAAAGFYRFVLVNNVEMDSIKELSFERLALWLTVFHRNPFEDGINPFGVLALIASWGVDVDKELSADGVIYNAVMQSALDDSTPKEYARFLGGVKAALVKLAESRDTSYILDKSRFGPELEKTFPLRLLSSYVDEVLNNRLLREVFRDQFLLNEQEILTKLLVYPMMIEYAQQILKDDPKQSVAAKLKILKAITPQDVDELYTDKFYDVIDKWIAAKLAKATKTTKVSKESPSVSSISVALPQISPLFSDTTPTSAVVNLEEGPISTEDMPRFINVIMSREEIAEVPTTTTTKTTKPKPKKKKAAEEVGSSSSIGFSGKKLFTEMFTAWDDSQGSLNSLLEKVAATKFEDDSDAELFRRFVKMLVLKPLFGLAAKGEKHDRIEQEWARQTVFVEEMTQVFFDNYANMVFVVGGGASERWKALVTKFFRAFPRSKALVNFYNKITNTILDVSKEVYAENTAPLHMGEMLFIKAPGSGLIRHLRFVLACVKKHMDSLQSAKPTAPSDWVETSFKPLVRFVQQVLMLRTPETVQMRFNSYVSLSNQTSIRNAVDVYLMELLLTLTNKLAADRNELMSQLREALAPEPLRNSLAEMHARFLSNAPVVLRQLSLEKNEENSLAASILSQLPLAKENAATFVLLALRIALFPKPEVAAKYKFSHYYYYVCNKLLQRFKGANESPVPSIKLDAATENGLPDPYTGEMPLVVLPETFNTSVFDTVVTETENRLSTSGSYFPPPSPPSPPKKTATTTTKPKPAEPRSPPPPNSIDPKRNQEVIVIDDDEDDLVEIVSERQAPRYVSEQQLQQQQQKAVTPKIVATKSDYSNAQVYGNTTVSKIISDLKSL